MEHDAHQARVTSATEWLHAIWLHQPLQDLPQHPSNDTDCIIALGWVERHADGWRVASIVPHLFGWAASR